MSASLLPPFPPQEANPEDIDAIGNAMDLLVDVIDGSCNCKDCRMLRGAASAIVPLASAQNAAFWSPTSNASAIVPHASAEDLSPHIDIDERPLALWSRTNRQSNRQSANQDCFCCF